MQRYIEQIIADLKEAGKNVPPETVFRDDEPYEEFETKMLAVENAPDVPAKQIYGLSYEELPPPGKLTEKQMQQLIDAVTATWTKFNISVGFPENAPLKLRYELIRDSFKDDVHYMPGWSMHQDFCNGWCPECKIVDYCDSVHEIWTKEELEEEQRKTSNNNT